MRSTQQRQADTDQLNAVTGGMEVSLFVAGLNKDMLAELKGVNAKMQKLIDNGLGSPTAVGSASGGTGALDQGGGGNGDAVNVKSTVVINVQGGQNPVDAILANATRIKRALENA
jgi:hypothetical protein